MHTHHVYALLSGWPELSVLVLCCCSFLSGHRLILCAVTRLYGVVQKLRVARERGTFEFMKQNSDTFGVTRLLQKCLNAKFGQSEITLQKKSMVHTGTTSEGLKMLSVHRAAQ